MSVLVRDMEMPKNCDECRFHVDGWCYVLRPESEEERKRITTNYCPLVEVPERVMYEDYEDLVERLRGCIAEQNGGKTLWCQAADAIDDLLYICKHQAAEIEEHGRGWCVMTLYEMLDKAMAHQKVWIYEYNACGQNMPLFQGTVNDARIEPDLRVWDFLMCEVEFYDCSHGILDIRVKSTNYDKRFEDHYLFADRWDRYDKSKRPWRHSIEIEEEKRAEGGE